VNFFILLFLLQVTIIALRCLKHLFRFKLTSFKYHNKTIALKLFQLLRTYAGTSETSTAQTGDNFELIIASFKAISTMIRDCEFYELDNEHLQILLHYVERNLYDSNRQASAFNLLKAIFSRQLQCDEMIEVVTKVMKLSIQSESTNVRLQSRQTVVQFMLDYSLGTKKLEKYLEFYIVQLNYEYEDGRESALEMLATIFQSFPLVRRRFFSFTNILFIFILRNKLMNMLRYFMYHWQFV
jgi:U3 small nucleolar RNA-associated protein 20